MSNHVVLNMNTSSVRYLYERDKRLAKVIDMVGPITYTIHEEDAYAFLIHEIIEQMLSVKAGKKIYERLVNLCEGKINPETIIGLSFEQIKSIGTASSKVEYIKCLTNEITSGKLNFDDLNTLSDEFVIKRLTSIKGIGNWTAKMYLIFVMDRPDVLPYEDAAFLQSYKWMYQSQNVSRKSVEENCELWHPYSSIASRFLYRALDMGFTKTEFHLQ